MHVQLSSNQSQHTQAITNLIFFLYSLV